MALLIEKMNVPFPESILGDCLAVFRTAGGVRRCAIVQVEDDLIHGCLQAGFDRREPDYPVLGVKINLKSHVLLEKCVDLGQAMFLKRPFEGKPPVLWEDIANPERISAVGVIPILKNEQCLAVVCLISEEPAADLLERRFRLWQHLGVLFSKIVAYDLANADLLVEKAKLEDILNGIIHGIMVVDRNLRILWANAFVGEMIGRGPPELVGMSYEQLCRQTGISSESSPVEESLAKGQVIHVIKHCPGRGPEPDRYLKVSCFPQKNSAGKVTHTIVHIRDVSIVLRSDMLQKDLTHMILHDIRNPILAANRTLDLSVLGRHGWITRSHREVLRKTRDSCSLLLAMLDDILDVYRFEMAEIRLHLQRINILGIIQKAFELIESLADEKAIEIKFNFPENLPEIQGDETRLVRVMINLLENAIKFSEKDAIVSVTAWVNPDGWLEVQVTDAGRGIPSQDLEKVFWKFYQVDKTTGERKAGVGVGLAFCRQTIEAHGGRIWAESPVSPDGRGSRFVFLLPLKQDEDSRPHSG